ncbi:hypothetical protein [Chamaesiphon sp. VAR_48_metabat_135_sub]|uniref:hypothetical protein n=1 Tax=Chamaesiphon sp. VAR_48_metabat_135_sub TaxID=2964699 RepID=UPI00286B012B|nr:hypothetical protein [Chamaesiphon sp. VAR_48_metabat_135_sub]
MPNVEDRLPLLIQKQLQAEIQQHPPLFPWETENDEYETIETESGNPKLINIPTLSPEPSRD